MDINSKRKAAFVAACILFILFILFTVAVKTVDVRAIGPESSSVGFAGLNDKFAGDREISELWYKITQALGYFALAVCVFFAGVGVWQLAARRSFKKVDPEIYVLGGFYAVVLAFYALFEKLIVNYRPVILDEGLEASYPSSHTVLAVCVFVTAAYELRRLFPGKKRVGLAACAAFTVLTLVSVFGRALSGVHWLTDVIGACLLSAALIFMYRAVILTVQTKRKTKKTTEIGETE